MNSLKRKPRQARVDALLVDRGLAATPALARALIMAGRVSADGEPVLKPGRTLPADAVLAVRPPPPYVSRAGMKLEEALRRFGTDVSGAVAADIGSSTGGFTDCLLRHGAAKVYAVDVDTRQLDSRLRADPRVIPLDRNARFIAPEDFPDPPAVATLDVAFISILKILPALRALPGLGALLALIKPQFEAERRRVGRGGVVRDPAVHAEVLDRVVGGAAAAGWACRGIVRVSTRGAKGNVEFFGLFAPAEPGPAPAEARTMIEEALHEEDR